MPERGRTRSTEPPDSSSGADATRASTATSITYAHTSRHPEYRASTAPTRLNCSCGTDESARRAGFEYEASVCVYMYTVDQLL